MPCQPKSERRDQLFTMNGDEKLRARARGRDKISILAAVP